MVRIRLRRKYGSVLLRGGSAATAGFWPSVQPLGPKSLARMCPPGYNASLQRSGTPNSDRPWRPAPWPSCILASTMPGQLTTSRPRNNAMEFAPSVPP